ncbi:TPA: UvrD-helicase domain-containing protein [Pseudomonas aeruginosa]|uniref:UvrD-helicase domain-containing protein n=1 Tax=Pseudomonas aeruginosa TaxID=287 RepID=UPI000B48B448|nr:UvrD-helicase domain-containing protein [Pseudomonas aeruginosa]EKU7417997.1 AAA family ATPase [Pseudomonas aeruginosa]EKV4051800.1 AAA family ATPase [Pseudomonas aeruginosa]MBF2891685.1 AAA family ATPase [Pseudomonas aeruginosa]MBF2923909.1 AAA family ATPase [Pseudomonas aeruginosa]MBF2938352.1 AAA family ATPase [Pseudomonas aeruginosa]
MTLALKIAMSDDFLKSFAAVPRSQQLAVLNFVAKFRQNPMATGINYERIRDAADPNMRSVRINDNMRGIVLKPDVGNVYCLLWVDQHDDAYHWARRHRVAIHPDVGSIQIYAVQEEAASAALVMPEVADSVGLFDTLKDREIRRLGVPDERLAAVRAVKSESELEALEALLPDEAFEALFLFAAGEPFDKLVNEQSAPAMIDESDFSAALERDSTRRHFVVLTDDSDLEALLAAPLERWRVFLHPSQRKLVERDWNGPVKVTGGAGTGKTVVAMHRAARLARQYAQLPGRPVLFTTFTKTLAEDIRQHLELLCTPQELEKIQVVNLDQWASGLLRRFGYSNGLLYNEADRRRFWQAAMSAMPVSVDLSQQFMRAEFERVVLPQGCETAEDYMRASRVGRGGQLGRAMRKALWPVFAEYRAQLQAANLREPEEAFREACQLLRTEKPLLGIRAMVVDEAQDISSAAFELIRAAVEPAENDLFIVGDAHQRIYRHKVVLSRVGIEVRGRSRSLKVNYRTTDEIRQWACAQLEGCAVDDLDGNVDSLRGYHSLTHGDAPDVIESASLLDDVAHVQSILKQLQDDGMELRQVCVTARTNDDVDGLARELQQAGVSCLRLENSTADDPAVPGVRLATMHRIKGLEFSVVILAAYKGATNYAEQFSRDEDAGVTEDTELSERCLLHVAATRAKRNLFLLVRP